MNYTNLTIFIILGIALYAMYNKMIKNEQLRKEQEDELTILKENHKNQLFMNNKDHINNSNSNNMISQTINTDPLLGFQDDHNYPITNGSKEHNNKKNKKSNHKKKYKIYDDDYINKKIIKYEHLLNKEQPSCRTDEYDNDYEIPTDCTRNKSERIKSKNH